MTHQVIITWVTFTWVTLTWFLFKFIGVIENDVHFEGNFHFALYSTLCKNVYSNENTVNKEKKSLFPQDRLKLIIVDNQILNGK